LRHHVIIFGLLSILAACAYGAQRTVLLPAAAKVSPEIRAHVQSFEEICIPFALHETELTLADDMALNSRKMLELGYEKFNRSRNCMSRTDIKWHPTQEFQLTGGEGVDIEMIWPKERSNPRVPGGSCAYAFPAGLADLTEIAAALSQDDSRWEAGKNSQNGIRNSSKISNPQFTVFDGIKARKIYSPTGQYDESLLQLFDAESGLTFTLNRRFQYDQQSDTRSDEVVMLKVKGENHDGQWAPFMPINCP